MKLTPELGLLIKDLYNIAMEQPLNLFKKAVLERLDLFLPMDSAIWVSISQVKSLYHHNDTFTYKQPDGCLDNYLKYPEAVKQTQDMAAILYENMNITMDSYELTPGRIWQETDLYLKHAKIYNQDTALITMTQNPINNIINTISFNRGKVSGEFTAQEKSIKQFIMPHIIESFRINILNSFSRSESDNDNFKAVIDKYGQLIEAEEGFLILLNKFNVIENNRVDIDKVTDNEFDDLKIIISKLEGDGLRYIEVIDLGEKPKLTERKKQICRLLAQGLSNKEIAKDLNITTATVSKHLQDVNKIFSVGSRYQAISCILRQQWYEIKNGT